MASHETCFRHYAEHIEILSQRYTQALERCDAHRALIFAGALQMRARDDQPHAFVADPYFMQWVPINDAPGSIIEFEPGRKPRLVFVTEPDFWHAPAAAPSEAVQQQFDVVPATAHTAASALSRHDARTVVIGEPSCATGPAEDSQQLLSYLDFTRAVKTEYEIQCMRAANTIAVAGHRAVEADLFNEISEFDLHLAYCNAVRLAEAALPYPAIIALNEHAAVLHYQHRDTAPPVQMRSLLIDAGAQCNGYASDVTRTHATDGGRFAELIDATDRLQRSVCALVHAGADFVALNQQCHELLAELLVELDLVRCTAAAAMQAGVTRVFLPHGLGHLLGLQVHDVGGLAADDSGSVRRPPPEHPFVRLTRRLEADMVITIEPGVYFIDSLLAEFEREQPGLLNRSSIDALRPYGGVRIEDNVRVKSDGHENLTRSAFQQ